MADNTKKDAQFYRTRQMATFVPIVGVPFMAAMFWLGNGGQGVQAEAGPTTEGINLDLPEASEASITSSKISAYSVPVDSMRNRELLRSGLDSANTKGMAYGVGANGQPSLNNADQAVLAAQQQLAAVQAAQQSSGQVSAAGGTTSSLSPEQQMEIMRSERQRELELARTQASLERIEAQANSGGGGAVVARPAAPKPKPKSETKARMVDDDAVVSRLGSSAGRRTASFQGFDANSDGTNDANTLPAVIHESQEVVSGSLVKMRLTESAVVNGHRLPANTFIYGKCNLSGERLSITTETLKSGNNVFPAALEVYDVDGLEGLHIPGAITRDAAKQAGADGLGAADMMTMSGDPTTAAAGVVLSSVKSLGQRKIRLVKVRLKAGYQVMLKTDKE